ncbi:FKBP-type peptidyl-prolyl cis-trans isomerase [Arthrobacter roseus]|uniref:FKBP-type peptidyl-prolyl cis-trans isomerase n=1 Tax=Arthrobacter roseus TaxID=136274 RepID=UPI0019630691|nr:peptidylprolyl isomerase [Arthrobacter roseus]
MRKVLAIILPALLLLTACGGAEEGESSGQAGALDSVTVTVEDEKKAPKVEFDAPLEVSEPSAKVVSVGDGDTVAEGDRVSIRLVSLDPEKGEELGNTYDQPEPQIIPLTDQLKKTDEALYEVLVGAKVGAQIAYMIPTKESEEAQLPKQLLVLKVEDSEASPVAMKQDEVEKLDEAGALPTAKLNGKGVPAITIPEGKDAPEKVTVQVLKQGDGAEVTKESAVSAEYLGVRWEDGKKFDSSFEEGRDPFEFSMSAPRVIEGWTVAALGHKKGSELLVTIPAELAYGEEPGEGKPAGALVFYMKLVDVKAEKAE